MPIKKVNGKYVIVPSGDGNGGRTSPYARRQKSELEGLIETAREAGFEREAEKAESPPKLSVLQRFGRGLTSFEPAEALYGTMYEDKPFLKNYAQDIAQGLGSAITGKDYREDEPKKTFKDILKMEGMRDRPGKLDPVDIAGFIGDVLTDPTTYAGGLIGKGISKLFKAGYGLGKKIPIAGKGLKGAEEATKQLFQPFYKIEQLGETGKVYRSAYEKYVKGTRNEVNDFMESMAEKAKKVKGKRKSFTLKTEKKIKKPGEQIGYAIETGAKTGNKLLDDTMDELVTFQKNLKEAEKARGILKRELPDYMHHMVTKEAADYLNKGGNLSQFIKPIRVKLKAAKPRKIGGTVRDINNRLRDKLGFELFEEDAFKAFANRGVNSIQAVRTFDFLQETARKFGTASEKDFIGRNGVRWISSQAPELKGMKFPEPIANHIDEFKKVFSNDEATNSLIRTYDKVLNFWKGSVTGYFPAFHTRNALGGVFNNFIAGLKNPVAYKTIEKILKEGTQGSITTKAGKKISYDNIRKMLKEYGVIGQTGYLDVSDYIRKQVSPGIAEQIAKAPAKVMGSVENRLRAPLFIDGLKKGYSPEQAAKRVVKFHFDYMPEGFTAFERNYMKRLIPFYTWTRHNIPLQVEQIVMQPGKYAGVFKAQRAMGVRPGTEEEKLLPRWLRERFTIKGEGGYWSGYGLPFEEMTEKISKPGRGFMMSVSPFIKTPIEKLAGYNFFKERRIEEDTYGKHYRNMPDWLKKWLQFKEHKTKKGGKYYTVNPEKKFWLEAVGARGLSTWLRVTNSKEDRKNLWSLITTIRKYNYTPEELQRWVTADKKEQLEKALYKAGVLRKFEKYYEPSD